MALLSANTSRFTFAVEGIEFLVAAFQVREQISRPYEINLDLIYEAEIGFDDVIGKPALLTIESADQDRYFHGVVSDFSQTGTKGRQMLYRARVVPAMALLALEQDCRIFQNMAMDAIVGKILNDAGIAADTYDFRLQGNHPQRDYCVQYRETDFDFISRLLEAEGVFYFFEHTTNRHVVVFGDSTVCYQPVSGQAQVVFNPGGNMVAEEEAVAEFERTRRLHTGKYSLQDYLFKNPALNLGANATGKEYDRYEVYEYPGGYKTKEEGSQLAKVRLQQAVTSGDVARGRSNIARLVPGFTFKLASHDINSFNQEYLVTEVTHEGDQPQVLGEHAGGESSYGNSFSAIPSSVTFRPKQTTPTPVVHGVHTAMVTGPSGEEIYTDEHGRVKVQFHWDRLGKRDDKSSCWIRVSQAWAGTGWGAMFIPRIGQEVIVDFIEGNPDRPIITGRVYHGTNIPPYTLPDEKTKSTFKSDSSLGGDGSNEIRFEDKKGGEEIFIHGQKDWTIGIEHDKNQSVGHDETLQVDNNRSKSVGKDQSESIGSNKTISVGEKHSENIGADASVTVGKNETRSVGETLSLSVGKNRSESIGENDDLSIGANSSQSVSKNKSLDVGENLTAKTGKDTSVQTGKKMLVAVGDNFGLSVDKKGVISIADQLTITVGSASLTLKKSGDILIKGSKFNVKVSGDVSIKGSKVKEN